MNSTIILAIGYNVMKLPFPHFHDMSKMLSIFTNENLILHLITIFVMFIIFHKSQKAFWSHFCVEVLKVNDVSRWCYT